MAVFLPAVCNMYWPKHIQTGTTVMQCQNEFFNAWPWLQLQCQTQSINISCSGNEIQQVSKWERANFSQLELKSSCHSSFSFYPLGPPVIVGMSINIASIDSISEVNMVRYNLFSFLSSLRLSSSSSHYLSVLTLLSDLLPTRAFSVSV